MPASLTLTDVTVGFGARVLFAGLTMTLSPGDVTAVVGVNGSGKSSLMRAIVGELVPDQGSISIAPADATVGWLPQVLPDPDETLLDHVRRQTGVAAADLALTQSTAALSHQLPGSDQAYSAALDRWLRLGAADLEDRLGEVCAKVGLHVDPHRRLGSVSGGEAARANLIGVLLSQYDLVLLDEPTNNLDGRGLALVTEFVRRHSGPVLLASHDRAFLDQVATQVVELDLAQQQIGHFTGGWSDYVSAKELKRQQAWEAYERYADIRDDLANQASRRATWADKGRSGPKATTNPDKHQREKYRARADKQAARAATIKAAVERLDEVAQPRKEWQLRYRIAEGPPSAEVVATLTGASITRGTYQVEGLNLAVDRGQRIAVLGDNGSGKSTIVNALFGRLELAGGRQQTGSRVRLGWLDQDRSILSTNDSVLEVVCTALTASGGSAAEVQPEAVRTLLAKFGLGADQVDRPARSLSLGERTRAMMALFQAGQVNTLVLDEPTNHLDVAGIEQLELAVASFTGTLVVISHDERFLTEVGPTMRWRVASGQVRVEAWEGST